MWLAEAQGCRRLALSISDLDTVERLNALGDPAPEERDEIEKLLAKIDTALSLLEPRHVAGPSSE
ncbi:hypothetical protein H8A97_11805 [Bradyrhizobium sp. Arg62]|uniref:hypothetical protein n=1 Tax=Bradyrhizobium brasilense TaxID=1419277 RepID=UPI001456541B|nr:hypothetical protein [Bradyrhizobium brasilense]MCC8945764.1 hypothetical protein [Bradyrhizobium brasilense]NLS67884.1 hypothetical protein [Bradyrhizobium brasilense]